MSQKGTEMRSPHPLVEGLPALYQEDEFTRQMVSAFDDILAPAIGAIDNFPAYLDPALTPDEFIDWLAGWVGVVIDETWPVERRRAFVAQAAEIYRMRGTAAGLARHLRLATGGQVEIVESGGAAWSQTAGAEPPGSPDYSLLVRVTPPAKGEVSAAKLDALVAFAKPAHVVHRVEIVERKGRESAS